jgi:hypothetical protein
VHSGLQGAPLARVSEQEVPRLMPFRPAISETDLRPESFGDPQGQPALVLAVI